MKRLIRRKLPVRRQASARSGLLQRSMVSPLRGQQAGIRKILDAPGKENSAQQIQRVIRTGGPDLSPYLLSKGVHGFSNPASSNTYSTTGIYYDPVMSRQILHAMLSSGRSFEVKGKTNSAASKNLDAHVKARKGVVDLSAKKKFGFATGVRVIMNTKYWTPHYYWQNGQFKVRWWYKKGVDKLKAMQDAYQNSARYRVACWAGTKMTMHAGSGSMSLVTDKSVSPMDWVPGDWGYIENTRHNGTPGQEGMNLIYVGNNSFWGHTSSAVSYDTLTGWEIVVAGWGKDKLMGWRRRTGVGLY